MERNLGIASIRIVFKAMSLAHSFSASPLLTFAGRVVLCKARDPGSLPGWGSSPGKEIGCPLEHSSPGGSAGGSAGKEPGFHPWARKIPWRRELLPTPVFWPGEHHVLVRGVTKSQM